MLFNYEQTDGYEGVFGKIKEWISHTLFVSLLKKYGYAVDYYLKLKLYSCACELLKKVMLYRVVRLDILDTKTLDTTCRLLEACIGYADQNKKDTTPKELVDYVDNLLQLAQVFEVDDFLSKGVKGKLCKLTQIRATCYK